jgi:hypothetical protein
MGSGDMHACIRSMNDLECWKECVAQLTQWPRHDAAIGEALLSFWMTFGYYSIPRGLKEELPVFIDALRHHLPTYNGPSLTLYRGEVEARHLAGIYGIAWTSRPKVASDFAANRVTAAEGNGVVLQIEASSKMIVAYHRHLRGPRVTIEQEYIIDPRMIRSVTLVPPSAIPVSDNPWD